MNAYIEVSTAPLPTAETAEALFATVDQHIGGGELSQHLRVEIVGRWGDRQRMNGALEWDLIRVMEVDREREVEGRNSPQVRLQLCIDATDWTLIDADTRQVAQKPGTRALWTATVVWSDDWFGQGIEGWRVRTNEQSDQPC